MRESYRKTILVVDDDRILLENIPFILGGKYRVLIAATPQDGIKCLQEKPVDLAIVDLNFGNLENDGLFLLDQISKHYQNIPVVVFSGDTVTERVVAATRYHLVEFVTKKAADVELLQAVEKGLALREMAVAQNRGAKLFQTKSPVMLRILDDLKMVFRSPSECPILILGESGTGKEVMAKHIASGLKKRLISTNMATITPELAEAELFGYKRGSFTGAYTCMQGV